MRRSPVRIRQLAPEDHLIKFGWFFICAPGMDALMSVIYKCSGTVQLTPHNGIISANSLGR